MRELRKHFRDYNHTFNEYSAKSLCGQYPTPAFTTLDDEDVTCLLCQESVETSYVDAIASLTDSVNVYRFITDYQKAIVKDLLTHRLFKRYTVESMNESGDWLRHTGNFNMNTLVRVQPYFYMPFSTGELKKRNKEYLYIRNTCFLLIGLTFDGKVIVGGLGNEISHLNPQSVNYFSDIVGQDDIHAYPWLTLRTNALAEHATWADGSPIGHKIASERFEEAKVLYQSQQDDLMHTLAIKDN